LEHFDGASGLPQRAQFKVIIEDAGAMSNDVVVVWVAVTFM